MLMAGRVRRSRLRAASRPAACQRAPARRCLPRTNPFLTCSPLPHPLHRSAIRSPHRQSHCRPIWAIYAVLKPSPRVTEQPNEEASQLREKVEKLETEIIHLKIDKAAK